MKQDELYLLPTPAGAYCAVAEDSETPLRRFLLGVIAHQGTQSITPEKLCAWSGQNDTASAGDFLHELAAKGWLEILQQPAQLPEYSMEYSLPRLLPGLSREGKVLLADTQGFVIFSEGFTAEAAEELAVLSADLANLHERRGDFLRQRLGLTGSAWALINAAGNSQVGFWPLHIGDERLVLVIDGPPALNQPQLVDFVLLLHRRFVAPPGNQ